MCFLGITFFISNLGRSPTWLLLYVNYHFDRKIAILCYVLPGASILYFFNSRHLTALSIIARYYSLKTKFSYTLIFHSHIPVDFSEFYPNIENAIHSHIPSNFSDFYYNIDRLIFRWSCKLSGFTCVWPLRLQLQFNSHVSPQFREF
jgi:hypothetical protein